MKTLDHYLTTDETGYEFISKRSKNWKDMGGIGFHHVITSILFNGGLIGIEPQPGVYVFGSMENPEANVSGDIWVTTAVVECDDNHIRTESGSEYELLRPFANYKMCTPYRINSGFEYLCYLIDLGGIDVERFFQNPTSILEGKH
ncbi:hypothetical protein IIW29_01125 [Candidatus Saccharibacteria bacterium]|nr:hypothetical protein [Candidatus Saccharibacteria bacterium]